MSVMSVMSVVLHSCTLTAYTLEEHHENGQRIGAIHWEVEYPESHNSSQCDLSYQQKSDVYYLRYNKLSRCHSRDHWTLQSAWRRIETTKWLIIAKRLLGHFIGSYLIDSRIAVIQMIIAFSGLFEETVVYSSHVWTSLVSTQTINKISEQFDWDGRP